MFTGSMFDVLEHRPLGHREIVLQAAACIILDLHWNFLRSVRRFLSFVRRMRRDDIPSSPTALGRHIAKV